MVHSEDLKSAMKLSRSLVAVLILLAGGVAQSKAGILHGSDIGTDELLTIDTSTGAGTLVGALGFTSVLGLAIVPEPSTLILAAIGLAGLAAFGWRRRKR